MFREDADLWDDALKCGVVVPLYKKGDRDDPGNYRGVCLLSMGSRILARIIAARLQVWAEEVGALDDDQQGFRKGRSTADAAQVMMRFHEDAEDLEGRRQPDEEVEERDVMVARLLDLKKAYPRVNKPALWRILERLGLDGDFLRTLKSLHETTEYKVRGKDGFSETWVPDRGLREGCPSSPPLFNVFHQAVMRRAAKERKKRAEEAGMVAGVVVKWVPGSHFPSPSTWEKHNSEAVELVVDKGLFADDTTVVGNKEEMEQGVGVVKEVMGWFEERNNDGKEEELMFGKEGSGKVQMLGSWMGWKEDVDQRLRRANKAWWMLKKKLCGSRLSKSCQAKIVDACVGSTILFDCHIRTWRVGEMKRLQKFMDRAYRYVWSRKNKPPLRQMQEEKKNMADVRKELGVTSMRWRVEKRILERIGHIMRMEDGRTVKAVVLGWVEQLERVVGPPKRSRRKTVLYWKKLLREAGLDWTRIGQLTSDRRVWKGRVRERMDHLRKWEWSQGHKWEGAQMERNVPKEEESVFQCDVCAKVCKSKAGLVIHRKRMHDASSMKKLFKCDTCAKEFKQEANLRNHAKVCLASVANEKVQCDACGKSFTRRGFPRHRTACLLRLGVCAQDAQLEEVPEEAPARVYKAKRKPCPECGKVMAATNISRHLREACINRDGGANP